MRGENRRNAETPDTGEWAEFRAGLDAHRRDLERTLRRERAHDARAAAAGAGKVSAGDLAGEAICWALDNWRAKPAGVTPEQWTRKRALQLLDEALDVEALVEESRAEERAEEERLVAHDLGQDDEERARWLDVALLASPDLAAEPEAPEADTFDGLPSDPEVSTPDDRMSERELVGEVERALLRLPERRRKAIAHRYLDGLSAEEIAYLLDTTEDAVEREIEEGLRTLRAEFAARA